MHVTIEHPLRMQRISLACLHGVNEITEETLIHIADFCEENMKSDSANRVVWRMFKEAAEGIVNNNLMPDPSVSTIGPFYLAQHRIPQKDDEVVIESGARIHSTHPQIPQSGKVSKRRQTVKVHRVSGGYYDDWHGPRVINIEVHWAGTGGYWKWTGFQNVFSRER